MFRQALEECKNFLHCVQKEAPDALRQGGPRMVPAKKPFQRSVRTEAACAAPRRESHAIKRRFAPVRRPTLPHVPGAIGKTPGGGLSVPGTIYVPRAREPKGAAAAMSHPYSYARGVLNTRVQVEHDGTLQSLREQYRRPVALEVDARTYHAESKRFRSDLKKALPYFVGGVIQGKRHDDNVWSRTLLTMDIEATDAQEPPPPPEEVFDTLESLGAEGWVYTSLSHTPESPRYRVVLPLLDPLEGEDLTADTLRVTTKAAARKLDVAAWCRPESWVLSQPMYLPARLRGGAYWEGYTPGKRWRTVRPVAEAAGPADIPDERLDPVLSALRKAGLYLREDPRHKGKHFFTCPHVEEHGAINDSQTVYYEPHHDGNPRAAVKCFDTDPDEGGVPHLTYAGLVQWLRDNGHLTKAQEDAQTASVLEDYGTFSARASIGRYLDTEPPRRDFAWDRFAPVGKVTVLAGPGGVSKSMLMLHLMVYGALGRSWAGFNVAGPLRGLYVSYEDDTAELHKRVHRLAQALREQDDGLDDVLYDINGALQKNLMLYAADEEATSWLLMNKPDQRGTPERMQRVDWLVGFVRHARLRVLVVDPVVYTHNLEESSPGDMALYMQTLNYIAKEGGCAVVVLHHMHKTAQWATLEEINQGSLRGASSFADNSRSVGVMVSMPPKDAPKYGLSADFATTSRFAVFKHVKHNYSASMGSVVFERKGALLIPRGDIQPLSHAEAKERLEDAKAHDRTVTLEKKAFTVIGWLRDQNDAAASTNMLRTGTNIRYSLFKETLQYCLDMGWLDAEPGPNRIVYYTVSKDGEEWFKERDKKGLQADKTK